MPRESKKARIVRAVKVCRRMSEHYPQATCALSHTSPFQLTIAVILSAQTTDASVNRVTPELFRRWPTPYDLAQAEQEQVEEVIRTIGLYHGKAKNIIACSQMLVSDFGGEVPHTVVELQKLPGVGRKTANVVLTEAFGLIEGIAVDTHVFRITHRLGFTKANTPLATEQDLLALLPRELWGPFNRQLVLFGRDTCTARAPKCSECFIADLCPTAYKDVHFSAKR